jgi:hypothetical protein
MYRKTLEANSLQTISWLEDTIIDWANSGRQYFLNGQVKEMGSYGFAFPFDSSVTSENGIYSVIYQKLGTKGILLKNGKLLREINRSYYQANVYEYPVTFATAKNGKTYLIHCPNEYCQIDFEEVETGEIVTKHKERKPSDFFHSRFEVSPDNMTLISRGWGWHPYDFIELFDIEDSIANPLSLDKSKLRPDVDAEICSASFINNDLLLIGSPSETEAFDEGASGKLKPGQIAVWDIRTNLVSKPVTPNFTVGGHLTAIDDTFAWDLFEFPKIINYKTGLIEDKIENIFSGQQKSSIIHHLDNLPKIAFNKKTKQVAIADEGKLEILTK